MMTHISHCVKTPALGFFLLTLIGNAPGFLGHPSGSQAYYKIDHNNLNSKCMDPDTGRELYVGDSFTRSGLCVKVQCLGTLDLWEDNCNVPQLEGNCYRLPAANEFLDYPRCCPTYECKTYTADDNSIKDETRTYNHYGQLLREHITQRVRVLAQPAVPSGSQRGGSYYNREMQPTSKITVFEIK